jgi:hypothetical protein
MSEHALELQEAINAEIASKAMYDEYAEGKILADQKMNDLWNNYRMKKLQRMEIQFESDPNDERDRHNDVEEMTQDCRSTEERNQDRIDQFGY